MIRRLASTTALCIALSGAPARAQLVDTVFAKYQAEVEKSAEKALAYLASIQAEDGGFGRGYGSSTGVVSLVGMAFLSKGYLPGIGKYGGTINRCVDFVLSQQQPNGVLNRGRGNKPIPVHRPST